jgi:glucose-6-phosphate isomerase/transaldolase/glucose-6-phosphate isomerase
MSGYLLSNTRVEAFDVAPGSLSVAYMTACRDLERRHFVEALWSRSLDIWTADAAVQQKIADRLGWLGAVDFIAPHRSRLEALAASVRSDGFSDIVLLGMGGSSLAPEVLRHTLGVAAGFPRFRMLDSVDPDAVRAALEQSDTSLFILASKSGSTIEPNVMAAEAQRRILAAGHPDWGSRFIAITDEGTSLHRRATAERFREVFVNPSDIGGRYSALSYFGMVPAALMGVDLERILEHARQMERACREPDVAANPGVALGALMAAGARNGRDKLTLMLPERLQAFGLWVEQLVAESTGKSGTGIIPITGEPADVELGDDRVAVVVNAGADRVEPDRTERVHAAGLPVATLELPDATAIGAEFLRWEVATATAGALLDINPFDEPNVQQAKDATRALLDVYTAQHRLPLPEPHASTRGATLTASRAAEERLGGLGVLSFLRLLDRHDYFALLAYLPPGDPRFEGPLLALRAAVAAKSRVATMFGYGPRYLHSTGQLHKGGPDTGVFLIVTAEPVPDLPVPDAPFSFGILELAQALGDFQSLDRAGRRALYVHLPDRDPSLIGHLSTALIREA